MEDNKEQMQRLLATLAAEGRGMWVHHSGDSDVITRLEVIDHTRDVENGGGRVYTHFNQETVVTYEEQDGGSTLKVFINPKDLHTSSLTSDGDSYEV